MKQNHRFRIHNPSFLLENQCSSEEEMNRLRNLEIIIKYYICK